MNAVVVVAADLGTRKTHLAAGGPGAWPTMLRLNATGPDDDWVGAAMELADMTVDVMIGLAAELGLFVETLREPPEPVKGIVLLVESPAFSQGKQAHQLGAVHGCVIGAARQAGFHAGHAHVSKVKKFITGKGNAGKPLVVSSIAARTGQTFQSDDEADAYGVWCYGMELAGQPHHLGRLPILNRSVLRGETLPGHPERIPLP